MDTRTREDITAAAAVHKELGPGYEDALAESLVERIGAEVDKRVDARLAQYGSPPARPAPPSSPVRSGWPPVTMALGSMVVGILGTLVALKNDDMSAGPGVAVIIWIVIGVVNIVYARRR